MATLLDELFRYVGFGPDDGARLIGASAALTPAFDAIVDRFYVAIEANPEARAVFTDEAQVARQKKLLRSWLVRFFAGPYDDSYFEERARIGRAHVRIGLPQRYVFVSMNVIRSGLIEAVAASGGRDGQEAVALQQSIHRLCDVELAIMLETYREDYDRALRTAERLATLGQFAGTLAHEMRNPLAVLSTSSHLLRRNAGDQPNVLRHVDRIERQISVCGQIVDDLLALARDRPPSFETVELRPLFEFAWAQVQASQHSLRLDIADDATVLSADASQLRQVLVNLLQNATQAMSEPGVVSIEVVRTTLVEQREEALRIRVEDCGEGFSAEALEHLFEPLFTTKARGIGLGLPLCQRVIAKHRGTLSAVNHEPRGARVDIVLPVAQKEGS
ncbi:MAG: histidine kinase [Sandaracinaceae bacterium]|nr:histidine kinase [Sandaracinaceae bacterium]